MDRAQQAARVADRYVQARTEAALDDVAEYLVDALFDELGNPVTERDVSKALQAGGLSADDVNALTDGKQAGGVLRALGGLVAQGLWRLIVQPFLAVGKLFRSSSFRTEVKDSFKQAIRREGRATRHAMDVIQRLALGESIHPQERKAAMKQLLSVLSKVLVLYFTGPTIAAMFSGGVWPALSRLMVPVGETLLVLLDQPIRRAMAKILSTGLDRMPFQAR